MSFFTSPPFRLSPSPRDPNGADARQSVRLAGAGQLALRRGPAHDRLGLRLEELLDPLGELAGALVVQGADGCRLASSAAPERSRLIRPWRERVPSGKRSRFQRSSSSLSTWSSSPLPPPSRA